MSTQPTLDTLHEDDPQDPHAFQRSETLASFLGITERTVRNMVSRKEVERIKHQGRSYYRLARPAQEEASGIPPEKEASEGSSRELVIQLQTQLAELSELHITEIRRLHEEAAEARQEAASCKAETLVSKAAAEHLQLAEAAVRAEVLDLRKRLEAERVRMEEERRQREKLSRIVATLDASPWYRRKLRRGLRSELELLTLEA